MKKLRIFLFALVVAGLGSCDLQLQENPNALSPDAADLDFVMNSVQFGMAEFFHEVSDYTMESTRLVAAQPRSSEYNSMWQGVDFDDLWEIAYAGILADSRNLVSLATAEGATSTVHAGIGKICEAYVIMTLVDMFGPIPYLSALDPNNFDPTPDAGDVVYDAAEALLDEAIALLAETPDRLPANDLFYGGDASKWTKLANTLKLKMYTNLRLIDASGSTSKIQAMMDGGAAFITDASDDWQFQFSTNTSTTPFSVHPAFTDNYGAASEYMSNYLMNELINGRNGVEDPRLRYYFYRQVLENTEDVNEQPCVVQSPPAHYPADMVFCSPGNGYWGRDHIDTDGIPPDNQLRTIYGVYPIGGAFDASTGGAGTPSSGLQGAGIFPMMLSSWVNFMMAELNVSLGIGPDAATSLENGVRSHIAKVMNMGAAVADPALAPTAEDVDAYVAEVLADFGSAQESTIGREYYITLFGNGIEAYNNYRRTGMPGNIQLPLNPNAGSFNRTYLYPSASVDRNQSMTQKSSVAQQVFWDNNPADFIK